MATKTTAKTTAKTPQKRGPKPKDRALIQVPVTIWVPAINKHLALAACLKIQSRYR